MKYLTIVILLISGCLLFAQEGLIPAFPVEKSDIALERLARPGTPFDKVGRRFAILGEESGAFEAWAYPLKLFRNCQLSFFVGNSTRPIRAADIVRYVEVSPAVTTFTYTYQSFTVRAHYITPVREPGALILLEVDSTVPLTVVVGFIPVLQPMWPAGLGGQYAYWNRELKAYVISESTGKNHGMLGSPAGEGISYTPAHMLSDTPSEFKIEIPDPKQMSGKYIPIVMAGGKGAGDSVRAVYRRLLASPEKYYRETVAYYRNVRLRTLKIKTPQPELNLAFEWAKIAYDNLIVENPDLGTGLVAGLGASGNSGRPGFGWFFGGDAYINSLSLNSLNAYATVRDALAFTQKWQRQDGKMAHELSQAAGYIDWWNDYHYGYIHGDTTPYYLVAMFDYLRMSGDVAFIRQSWKSLKKAYQWCLKTDANGDGLMDNRKAGLGATEYGDFTGVETDIYLAAVWVQAIKGMQYMAEMMNDKRLAKQAGEDFKKARQAFDRKFWNEAKGMYSFAFNTQGEQVTEVSPWSAVGLMWQLGQPERSQQSLEKINSAELTTDWGVRSISIRSKYYQPLNYNYGAVWPFLTSWVTTAQFKHHQLLQGYATLMSTVRHTFDNQLGAVTEVFSGTHNVWPQEAVAQQGFSTAGVILPTVRGLLGLEADALQKRVQFEPHLPADWDSVMISNYRIGKSLWQFAYYRRKGKIFLQLVTKNASGYQLTFAPALGRDTRMESVTSNGETVSFELKPVPYLVQPQIVIPITKDTTQIVIKIRPTVEFLPVVFPTRTGDRNQGLKIVSLRYKTGEYVLKVDGLAGKTYELPLVNSSRVREVKGAQLQNDRLIITFPQSAAVEFVRKQVKVILRNWD